MFKKSISEAKTLEQYRVALKNVELQPKIASTLAEFGYDRATVATGKALYEATRQAFDSNKTETDQSLAAYAVFDAKKLQLDNLYSPHRRKAKVIFREDPVAADKLAVSGAIPMAYTKWIETVRKFYATAIADTEIQTKLGRLKITLSELNTAQTMIPEVEALRAAYLKEKGESQDATDIKDSIFARLDDWMRDFYAVAKIALEENPQLMESLGKVVKG